ncbi:MAG: rubrerythrin family protein [Candidatus Ozemobacteraceae bacterium]
MSTVRSFGMLLSGLVLTAGLAFAQAPAPTEPVAEPAKAPAAVEPAKAPPAEPAKTPTAEPVAEPAKTPAAEPAKAPASELKIGTTLENLEVALAGETNAQARYLAFAAKADEEKFLQVGRLFRAAAKSEEIHAAHHAKIITELGGKPNAVPAKAEVKSTKENLEAALAGETQEFEKMYPAFIEKAKEEKKDKAMKTFMGANSAEKDHAKFFQDAIKDLDAMKELKHEYLVCQVCGHTTANMDIKKCPVCDAPRTKFEAIK